MGKRTQIRLEGDFPTEDRSGRFPNDVLLRSHGYRIRERKKGKEPIWELNGRPVRQSVALELVGADKK